MDAAKEKFGNAKKKIGDTFSGVGKQKDAVVSAGGKTVDALKHPKNTIKNLYVRAGEKEEEAFKNRTAKKVEKLRNAGKHDEATIADATAAEKLANTDFAKKALRKNGAIAAGMLVVVATMAVAVRKIMKANPNSAVAKEAKKRLKELEREIKQAQKELKKAKTPAETKAASKKIKTLQKKVNKLKTQIGRLADKNLSPKEVEAVKKSLEKMVAESVVTGYTEAELMFTGIQMLTESVMMDHYYALELEAAEEEAEMDDIFGEDAYDYDYDDEMEDIFGEDAEDWDEDFEESFDDFEDGPEFEESVFDEFDLDW